MVELDKWYLDCVTEDGGVVLAYWAALRLGPFRLRYAACLTRHATPGLTSRTTLRPGVAPSVAADEVRWTCSRVGVSGTWGLAAPAFNRTLLDGPGGRIAWHCLGPRTVATVRVDGRELRGTGYVERLTMSLPPWRLPFRRLRWGRFHGRDRTLVWIGWEDGLARRWVFDDGIECRNATVGRGEIALGNGSRLDIDAGVPLRTGQLRGTALRPLRALVAVMPRWRLAHETKWLARACLQTAAGAIHGWALHEEVTWG